jgi:hypothetical protein
MKYPTPAFIEEMKARGYDAATIAEFERQSQRWPAAHDVCRLIEEAFAGVTLGCGVGLYEGQAHDDWEYGATAEKYRARDEKEDWHRLSADALNACHSSLSFFDAEGMRFHLPAFLLADLRGDYKFGMTFCLTYAPGYHDKFRLLSDAQRRAVRAYLLHIAEDMEYDFSRPDILRALEDYWTAPASP